jgi:hypothetical protein
MASELDPRDLIDRLAEQEVFTEILPGPGEDNAASARVLTICDKGGRGKSALLARLLYNCRYEVKPPASGCLIPLDQLIDPAPFSFIKQIYDGLMPVPGDDIKARFAKFKQLNEARELRDFSLFGSPPSWPPSGPGLFGSSQTGPMGPGARSAGLSIEEIAHVETQNIYSQFQRLEFTEEQERRAQEKCVEAFFEDLRTVCATQTIVVLLDAWERCNVKFQRWITDVFLGNYCLHPDKNLRPARFAIVIAGRPFFQPDEPYGLRADEFRPLFDTHAEFETMVRDRRSLSEWEHDHVEQFMINNGCPAPSGEEIAVIQAKLKTGWSLLQILNLIGALTAGPATVGPVTLAPVRQP